jgi:hypothetical protein
MIAPDSTQPTSTYESAAYRAARQREQIAAIMAAMRAGKTNREIVGQLNAAEAAEERDNE